MSRLEQMLATPEHATMAKAAVKLEARQLRRLGAGWFPLKHTVVGVLRHTGKLEPCVFHEVRDGWAYVTALDDFFSSHHSAEQQRTFYKGGHWIFQLPPAQWRVVQKTYPGAERG
jgi:hypothetical protein